MPTKIKPFEVPTNVVTGFFGAGKTTAIRHLLTQKPADERWAILVNEFGDVPIDQAALTNSAAAEAAGTGDVTIQEIVGGCLCCTMNTPMQAAIAEVLRHARPHRLLIEPTGLGHPAGIVDTLCKKPLAEAIDLRAVICLVDPRFAIDPRIQAAEAFRDQAELADVLIANKCDLAEDEQRAAFDAWAAEFYPTKVKIAQTTDGRIDIDDLDLPATSRAPLFPNAHSLAEVEPPIDLVEMPYPGVPVQRYNAGHGYRATGWIFAPADRFGRDALLDLLGSPGLVGLDAAAAPARVKGVFHTDCGWILIDRAGNEVSVNESAYRRDSRVEIILDDNLPMDTRRFEDHLLACILTP